MGDDKPALLTWWTKLGQQCGLGGGLDKPAPRRSQNQVRVSAKVVPAPAPVASVAVAVTWTVPPPQGLPVIRPEALSRVRPQGRPVTAYRTGGFPPVVVSWMVQD